MTGEDNVQPQRRLLMAALDLVREELPVSELFAPSVDVDRVVSRLRPSAHVDAVIEWVSVNGERVDAVVTAGESQWRIVFRSSSEQTIDWLDVYERPTRFDGVSGGRATLINGPSGAGKSTLMRAMQQIANAPLMIFDEPEHIGTVQPEYLIWRDRAPALHRGYLDAIAAMARAGNDVALPAAGHRQAEFVDAFGDVPICTIGLSCDLEVRVHDGWTYDIEFDTTHSPDPLELARQIAEHLGS